MSPPPISFVEKVIRFVESKCAASVTAGGFDFLEKLYFEYCSNNQEDTWLFSHLLQQFRFVNEAPRWIENEPAWPFCEGKPMLFLCQQSVGQENHDLAGSGYTVYFFVGRKQRASGFELEFREIVQSESVAQAMKSLET